jgi:hypothetical protein
MNDWSLKITRAKNGYICEWEEDWTPEDKPQGTRVIKKKFVFEEKEREGGDLDCMSELLWFVKEHFGIMWNKHNPKNLDIKVVLDKEVEEE